MTRHCKYNLLFDFTPTCLWLDDQVPSQRPCDKNDTDVDAFYLRYSVQSFLYLLTKGSNCGSVKLRSWMAAGKDK